MIHTSNYAKHGTHPDAVSISLWVPDSYKGIVYRPLQPTESILYNWRACIASNSTVRIKQGKIDYTKKYTEDILYKLDPVKVWKDIGINAILLCYESGTDFCHRHLVAAWLMEKLEMTVTELPAGRKR